jgi:plastocyanin
VRFLDSGDVQLMKPGETVSVTFDTPGLFKYDCSLHPKDMHGSVLVGDAAAQPSLPVPGSS